MRLNPETWTPYPEGEPREAWQVIDDALGEFLDATGGMAAEILEQLEAAGFRVVRGD